MKERGQENAGWRGETMYPFAFVVDEAAAFGEVSGVPEGDEIVFPNVLDGERVSERQHEKEEAERDRTPAASNGGRFGRRHGSLDDGPSAMRQSSFSCRAMSQWSKRGEPRRCRSRNAVV